MKGILIEKRKRKSIVMDHNGRFMKTKTMRTWNEGDEVSFVSPAVKTARGLSIAAAFVLVLALGLFMVYTGNAYTVYLDVNPSIEIDVNAFNTISSIQALNDDAEEIGDLSSLVGMKFGPAINLAIQMLVDEGFLAEDGTVVLSIDGKNGKLKTVEKEVAEVLADVDIETEDDEEADSEAEGEEGEPKLKIYIGRITEEMAEAAEDLDVPVGRIVLAEKAVEEGADITYDMAAALSVQELQRIRNLCKTIHKTTGLIEEESEKGNGNMKQIEAMTDKILRDLIKLEGNLAELQAIIDAGDADEDTLTRYDVLNQQISDLLAKLEMMGIAAETETEEVLNGMAAYNGASPEEKARIREEIKEAKKADNDAKHEENRSRIEEHLAAIKEKVSALKNAKEITGEPEEQGENAGENAGEDSGDDSPGNSGNSNAGGKGKGNGN